MRKLYVLSILFVLLSGLGFAACPDGMVSYWTFDNDSVSGSTVEDVYGNNDGSIYGATPGASARVGEAFSFDGNNDYIQLPSNIRDIIKYKSGWSYSIWVYKEPGSSKGYLLDSYATNHDEVRFPLRFDRLSLVFDDDSAGSQYINLYETYEGDWHHIISTLNESGICGYVDGNFHGCSSLSGSSTLQLDRTVVVGVRDSFIEGLVYFLDGKIDEVAIFNRALNASEVAQLYNQSSQGYDYCGTYKNTLPLSSKFTEFESTTNFSQVQNLSAVENLTLGSPHGTISFGNNTVNAENQDYNKNIVFGDCFVAVNATALDYTFNATAYLLMNNSDGHCGDDTIFVTSQVVADAGAIKNGAKICQNCKKVKIGEDTVTFKIPHFSSYAIGSNSNLTIDANDPKLVNQTVTFTAIYKNSSSGDFISGANCQIELQGTTSAMSEGTEEYVYQTSFTENQTYSYNVTCNKAGYQQLKINDSFEILPATGAVPEFSSIVILALITATLAFYLYKKR